jgi:CheY-like chemotaxis protein
MPKKILLADDSITIQKVVELTFSDGDYEVIAVNNGAKAIQKLSEMRPDIILSDIIMPEKNGYEVCEYVKSHPDFRTIPVVLLTGTFEPFDPDRADKAGCDAVVTKPFESQSLIHKVEELINQSHNAPAATESAPAAQAESPWAEEEPAAPAFAPPIHDNDIFGAAPSEPTPSASDMPFETSDAEAFSGETRAFQRVSFEEMQRMAAEAAPQQPEPAPIPPAAPPVEPPQIEPSPWDEPPAAFGGGETRAFPAMSFDEPPAAPPLPPTPEASPWDEQPPAFGGETKAFPRMSFEELQQMASQTTPEPAPPAEQPPAPIAETSPWSEPEAAASPFGEETPAAAFSGETQAFQRLSFDELQQMAAPSEPAASPFHETEPAFGDETASFDRASALGDEISVPPVAAPEPEPQPEPEATPAVAAAASGVVAVGDLPADLPADLTDEQIDRIARRVVQLLSADVVKNIAWEVIPDMAEMVVKERIRQLESEA